MRPRGRRAAGPYLALLPWYASAAAGSGKVDEVIPTVELELAGDDDPTK